VLEHPQALRFLLETFGWYVVIVADVAVAAVVAVAVVVVAAVFVADVVASAVEKSL